MSTLSSAFGLAVNALRTGVGSERAAMAAECARTAFDLDAYSMGMAMMFAQVREPPASQTSSSSLTAHYCARSRSLRTEN